MTTPERRHLAVPVDDVPQARSFPGDVLGCGQGREAPRCLALDAALPAAQALLLAQRAVAA